MSIVRLVLRTLLVVVFSLLAYMALLVGIVATLGRSRAKAAWQSHVLALWAKTMAVSIGMRSEIIGEPPDKTGIFVANHLSYVDIVLIAASMRTAFVAKYEVQHWPVIGHVVKMAGTIFVNRERHRSLLQANDAISATLDSKTSVVVFAEGSSTDGVSVLPFRPSLLNIAAVRNMPVHHGYLTYQIGPSPSERQQTREQICWWGDAGFFRHIAKLLMLPGFSARLVFGEGSVVGENRKMLAAELHGRVVEQFHEYSWSRE